MWDATIQEKLRRFEQLTQELADPAVLSSRERLRDVSREHAELTPIVATANRLEQVKQQLTEARQMIAGADVEMAELAEAEAADLAAEIGRAHV